MSEHIDTNFSDLEKLRKQHAEYLREVEHQRDLEVSKTKFQLGCIGIVIALLFLHALCLAFVQMVWKALFN